MQIKPISFLHSIFGLSVTPVTTTTRLLAEELPRHSISLLLSVVLTLSLPFAVEMNVLQLDPYRQGVFSSILIVFFFTYTIFTLLELVLLQILGIDIRLHKMFAAITYSIVPLMFACWCIYILNFFFDGSLTIITKIITSRGVISQPVRDVFHIGLWYSAIFGFLVFVCSIRAVTQGSLLSAICLTIFSAGPLYISSIIGVSLAEMAFPGTLSAFREAYMFVDTINQLIM